MTHSTAARDASTRSPFAGCAILIAAVAVMVFLIGFSVLTLFRQFHEIAKFTAEKPVPIEVTSLENQQPALQQLATRLDAFRQQLSTDQETSLALSAEDLNLAIAHYETLHELRGTFRVIRIEKETLQIAISFPLNGKPRLARTEEPGWVASDSRFLNGTLVARPSLLKHEVVLSLDTIEVPGKKVAPEFIDQMSPYRLTERYLVDPILGPAMAKFTRVSVADGKIIFSRKPNETPVDTISDAQVDSASGRLFSALGLAALAFLAFAGIIVLLGARAKARKSENL